MKWFVLLLFLLLAGSVYAEVESFSSGVFRGSLRHVVTISEEDVVSNVNAGDYLSFRFPDKDYLRYDFEENDVYLRRFDLTNDLVVYDVQADKFNELAVGESILFDIDGDGADDIQVEFTDLERKGVFTVRDVNYEPCTIACYSDDDCSPSTTCVFSGTCDSFCEVDENINPPPPEFIPEPQTPEPELEEVPEEKEKGFFTRIWEWIANLF